MGIHVLKAFKTECWTSKVEKDKLSIAQELLDHCAQMKVNVHLPVDHICKSSFSEEEEVVVVDSPEIPEGLMGLDIGPKTREQYSASLKMLVVSFGMVRWASLNGKVLQKVPEAIGKALNSCTQKGGYTIVGGGDSAAAVGQMELTEDISHISTGGGASLAYLEERPLPGLVNLKANSKSVTESTLDTGRDMRRLFIAGNWKMNLGVEDAGALATSLTSACAGIRDVDIAVAPTEICLTTVLSALKRQWYSCRFTESLSRRQRRLYW